MSGLKNSDISVIVLAGGFGTRLRSLDDTRPKPMVLVAGNPFLHWLIQRLYDEGFRKFIFSTGYKAEVIEEYPWQKHFPQGDFKCVRESIPLGTGGAVLEIFKQIPALQSAWVINGDTLLENPLPAQATALLTRYDAIYVTLHCEKLFDALPNLKLEGDLVLAEVPDGDAFDGGAVFLTRHALSLYKGSTPCSLHEVLTPVMQSRRVGAVMLSGTCYDIGTPERYKRFEDFLKNLV